MLPLPLKVQTKPRFATRFVVAYEELSEVQPRQVTPRCGAQQCVPLDIEPDQFLSDPHARTCWDCPLVGRKIGL